MAISEERRERKNAYMKAYYQANKENTRAYYEANKDRASAYDKEYYQANKEKLTAYKKSYAQANREKIAADKKDYHEANREKIATASKEYRQTNKEKLAEYREANKEKITAYRKAYGRANPGKINAQTSKRRAAKIQRTPNWLTVDDYHAIRTLYETAAALTKSTGIEHHVDHIIPLRGKIVSGFHCPTNLQILTATENHNKYNKFTGEH